MTEGDHESILFKVCTSILRWAGSLSRYSDWTVRGSNPGGARFSSPPDGPWGPPRLLFNGYRVSSGGKVRPGRAADHSLLVPRSWEGRAIPLPTLWATTGPVTGIVYLIIILT
jgi:hypothetical protein